MAIYIFVIILLLSLIYIYDIQGLDKGQSVWEAVVLFFLVLIPTFSVEMGSDTMVYEEWYLNTLPPIDELTLEDFNWEPFFVVLMSIIKLFFDDWLFPHFILIFFINYSVYFYIKRYTAAPFTFFLLYFLLYYYEINFEPLRQSVAMAIFLWSIPFFNYDLKKYVLIVLLAACFHFSAIIALTALLFRRYDLNNKYTYVIIGVLLLSSAYLNQQLSYISSMLALFLGDDKYDYSNSMLNITGVTVIVLTKIVPVFLAIHWIERRCFYLPSHLNAFLYVYVLSVVAYTMFPIMERFSLFYSVFAISLFSSLLCPDRWRYETYEDVISLDAVHVILQIYVVLSFSWSCYAYYNAENIYGEANTTRFIPYKSIIDN